MPGVIVATQTYSGPITGPDAPPSARFFVAGLTERGPSDTAGVLRSLGDYLAVYGERVPYGHLYDALDVFFAEGGAEAVVGRVVGDAATTGLLVLSDSATTPVDTLRIEAASAGAWSSRVSVEVTAGTTPGTFRIIVALDGSPSEAFTLASPAEAVAALQRSKYVRALELGSATAAPDNNPAPVTETSLSAGTDDRATVTAATVTDGLALFPGELGPGAVATPGYPAGDVGAALIAHAATTDRIALLSDVADATDDDALITAADLSTTPDSDRAGLFYPWLFIPGDAGMQRAVPPEGYVAGVRARTHTDPGPWRPPAGQAAIARYVLGPVTVIDRTTGDRLNEGHVSAIRTIAGTTRLYGWRSLSLDVETFGLLTARDMLNWLSYEAELRLEEFVFATIDGKGRVLADVEGALVDLVDPVATAGGLYPALDSAGRRLDPGYTVDASTVINTASVLARNEIHAVLQVRISPVGQLIYLTIVKTSLA